MEEEILLYAIDQNNLSAAELILAHNQLLQSFLPKFCQNYQELLKVGLKVCYLCLVVNIFVFTHAARITFRQIYTQL